MVQIPTSNQSSLSDDEIVLVQASFSKVLHVADAAATLFYDRLFVLDPSLRPLFKGDMMVQKKKLMQMLKSVVFSLRQPEIIVPAIQELGQRHVQYHVSDAHYESVGAALLWALEQGLGKDFTSEVRSAWVTTYRYISSIMKEGSKRRMEFKSE